jgi:hypothetical protein
MTAHMKFFPTGNADTTFIQLANNKVVLMDYAHMRNINDPYDKRIDLPSAIREAMDDAGQTSFKVVAFTHLDKDHVYRSSEFFWFDHAKTYQGGDRFKIDELWVPAGAITEMSLDDDARVIRQEARYRLKMGYGIKVFSRPASLASFLEENGLSIAEREHCIVDGGKLVPGFSKWGPESAEFFVHSPFAWRTDAGLIDRNQGSIVVQMTMREGASESYALLGADIDHESLSQIVRTSRDHGNQDRLHWDILKLFHHCSYLSLSPEKGEDITEPVPDVKWLFETLARQNEKIISPSWPIPKKGSPEDKDAQPPHRQAAAYYKKIIRDSNGQFLVTMEQPSEARPQPIRLKITAQGVSVMLAAAATATSVAASTPTRAGRAG